MDGAATASAFAELEGVFVADQPVDVNEGAKGDVVISIELAADESELAGHEIVEDRKLFREWCLPDKLPESRPDCVGD